MMISCAIQNMWLLMTNIRMSAQLHITCLIGDDIQISRLGACLLMT